MTRAAYKKTGGRKFLSLVFLKLNLRSGDRLQRLQQDLQPVGDEGEHQSDDHIAQAGDEPVTTEVQFPKVFVDDRAIEFYKLELRVADGELVETGRCDLIRIQADDLLRSKRFWYSMRRDSSSCSEPVPLPLS